MKCPQSRRRTVIDLRRMGPDVLRVLVVESARQLVRVGAAEDGRCPLCGRWLGVTTVDGVVSAIRCEREECPITWPSDSEQ